MLETINTIINFITTHYNDLLAIIGGIVSVSTLIVKLTPNTRDDEILNKIVKFLDKFSVVNTKKNEEIIEENKKV